MIGLVDEPRHSHPRQRRRTLASLAVRSTRDDLLDAISLGCLRRLDAEALDCLLSGAILHHFARGQMLASEQLGWVGVVISGLVRTFMWTPDGRQVTTRVVRPGDLVGASRLAGREERLLAHALGPARVLELSMPAVQRLAASDASMAMALIAALAEEVDVAHATLEVVARRSVRARLCRHLVELAVDRRCPGRPPDPITLSHEELAEAIGTVREVVTRHLAELNASGLLTQGRGWIRLTHADRLLEIA